MISRYVSDCTQDLSPPESSGEKDRDFNVSGAFRASRTLSNPLLVFGDTINTCARMESTGIANKIQLSHETAELIVKSGNSHWLEPRKDRVQAKGKGELTTFWLTTKSRSETTSSVGSGTQSSSVNLEDQVSEKLNSLIEWNVETLLPFIQKIMDWRRSSGITQQAPLQIRGGIQPSEWIKVKESISLPSIMGETNCAPNCAVSSKVQTQLRDYVTAICEMYVEAMVS